MLYGAGELREGVLGRLKSRDPPTITWFFKSRRPQLVKLCMLTLRDRGAAEDIADEAREKFLTKDVERVREEKSLDGYLRRMAYHLAIRERAKRARIADASPPAAVDPALPPDDLAALRIEFERCFRRLE